MPKYRNALPQLSEDLYLTDGGLETTLIFHDGLELPYFAAFTLLKHESGRQRLRDYFRTYIAIAEAHGAGFILESPTWRASQDWAKRLGYSRDALAAANGNAIALLAEIRSAFETKAMKLVISGCMGPRGDGYNPSERMTEQEAQEYHAAQIETFKGTAADMVTAATMTYCEEAIGIARAAAAAQMPVVISFTVETDGKLPSGQVLKETIANVDKATNSAPIYYMINCAHPTHFQNVLAEGGEELERIRGVRANASSKSHAELDEAEELDDGNPAELGQQYLYLRDRLKSLNVVGGCCGTDQRHVEEIAKAWSQNS